MKKLIIALIQFALAPLAYIGGYYVVKHAQVPEFVAGFLAFLGCCIILFNTILTAFIMIEAYKEIHGIFKENKGRY